MIGPRILEAFPDQGKRLTELEAAMKDAALELALEQVLRSANGTTVEACFRCGVHATGAAVLDHQTTCPVGRILAYVEAVCDARMSDMELVQQRASEALAAPPARLTGLTSEDHRFIDPYHVEYLVPGAEAR